MEWEKVLLAYILFWAIIYLVYNGLGIKKENIIVRPFFLMIKTTLLNDWIKRLASVKKKIVTNLLNIGIIVGASQMAFIIYFLLRNLDLLFQRAEQATGFVLLLPGLTISWGTLPYIIIVLFITLATHELAHGIAALIDKVPLKSAGIFLAIVMPGGFVEIDEDVLNKSKIMTKLRVFAAGSFANIAVWALIMILLTNFAITISPFYNSESSGVLITGLVENGPAQLEGLRNGDVIFALNGTKITDVDALRNFMQNIAPNSYILADTSAGMIGIQTQPHPAQSNMSQIGVYPFDYHEPRFSWASGSFPYHLYLFEFWASIILLWIALFNMIPLYPLDGDRFLYSILERILPKYSKMLRISISIFSLALLGSNFLISTLTFGLVRI
jgi:membrane-associated protease RseP (regulator of RpoE activity)